MWRYWWHHHRHSCRIWGKRTWTSPSTPTAGRWRAYCTRRCNSTPGSQTLRTRSCTRCRLRPSVPPDSPGWDPPCSPSTRTFPTHHSLPLSSAGCSHRRGSRRRSPARRYREWTPPVSPAGQHRRRCIRWSPTHSRQWRKNPTQIRQSCTLFAPRTYRTNLSEPETNGKCPLVARSQCCRAWHCRHLREFPATQCTRTCSQTWM